VFCQFNDYFVENFLDKPGSLNKHRVFQEPVNLSKCLLHLQPFQCSAQTVEHIYYIWNKFFPVENSDKKGMIFVLLLCFHPDIMNFYKNVFSCLVKGGLNQS